MLGFHRRARSLISVKTLESLEKFEKVVPIEDDWERVAAEHGESAGETSPRNQRQLMLIYVVFVAEASVFRALNFRVLHV